jgi:hypothetical protein
MTAQEGGRIPCQQKEGTLELLAAVCAGGRR